MIYLDSAATSFTVRPVWQKRWQRPFPVWETAPEELIKKHFTGARVILRPGSFYQKCSMEMVRSRWHLQPILPKA